VVRDTGRENQGRVLTKIVEYHLGGKREKKEEEEGERIRRRRRKIGPRNTTWDVRSKKREGGEKRGPRERAHEDCQKKKKKKYHLGFKK
jgi:hypothetical protein